MENEKTAVVLGGSFNPPTLAHKKILEQAVKLVNANFGIFVPSSNNYVTRKMSRTKRYNQVYTEEQRVDMLEALSKDVDNIIIDDCELGDDGKGHTVQTLKYLKEKYKLDKIYFLLGTDNLAFMLKWRSRDELFNSFNFVVMERDGNSASEIIDNDDYLSKHRDKFNILKLDSSIDGISSTLARELITNLLNVISKDELKLILESEA